MPAARSGGCGHDFGKKSAVVVGVPAKTCFIKTTDFATLDPEVQARDLAGV